jgi:hypothetical protein
MNSVSLRRGIGSVMGPKPQGYRDKRDAASESPATKRSGRS